ncbi:MAG TPA: glycoside hydrolase family 18 protein [Bryobacteraceae bacterium]|jgi:chitinase|nr:glycoside hydrolase family 18 protein [Bryobacteraceae bacterium]
MTQSCLIPRFRTLAIVICTAVLLTYGLPLAAADSGGQTPKLLGAYFEEWSIYGADYNIADVQNSGAASDLTHLLYAFANVSTTAQCAIADSWADYQSPYLPSVNGQPYTGPLYGNFAALQQLKQLHPSLKVMISIGGASAANTANFSSAAATAAGRQQLAASCIDMFVNGNVAQGISTGTLFDGIDLDWEFPTAADKLNFTALLAEFRSQLDTLGRANHKHYLLSIAAPAGSQNYSNMQLAAVAQHLDFLNMETYDYHGTWETITNHAAPLLDSPLDPAAGEGLNVDATITAYLHAGVPAVKMLLGIPFYGRGWTGVPDVRYGLYQSSTGPAPSPAGDTLATDGVATFRTLEQFPGVDGFASHRDYFSLADWLYSPLSLTFWTYDDPPIVTYKVAYAKLRAGGLGGAFGWALKDDDSNATLVKTMAKGLDIQPH